MKRDSHKVWNWFFAVLASLFVLTAIALVGGRAPAAAIQQETLTPTFTATTPPTATPTATPTITPTRPAATLVPPTPLPTLPPAPANLITGSALGSIQSSRTLRVGTFFNAYPFSWLDELGVVQGYEADIMRAVGIELGAEIEFVQVTRHNADQSLQDGLVDVIIGQQIHTRDREERFDFTHPFYVNHERMVVQTDAPYFELVQLAGLPVSVEVGSRSERALRHWMVRTGVTFDVRTFLSESDALDALANGDVQGMLGTLDSLRRAGRQQMRLIDEPVLDEYYAVVLRRGDINLLNLLNRSLQRLKASGRLDQIFADWFPEETIDFDTLVPVYEMLYEDERTLDQFNADMPIPATTVLERLASGEPLRIAGLVPFGQDAPARVRIINALNQAIIDEFARRWSIQILPVPDSALDAVDLVANGQADLAVGVSPRWDGADRVEYSLPYIRHGDRLLVPVNSSIGGFADMLGTGWWIGYFADDALDAEHIQKYADFFGVGQNIRDPFAIQRENEAIYTLTVENNIDAIFGDSLRLLALMREDGGRSVEMLDTWYGDVLPITFAVPRNDSSFRNIVNFTLQDMARDGTYQQLWAEHFALGDPLPVPFWENQSPDVN